LSPRHSHDLGLGMAFLVENGARELQPIEPLPLDLPQR